MFICLCHPFSDKTAKAHMTAKGGKVRVSEVYSACSDGNKPNCCACLESLKTLVKDHNKTVAV